MAPISWRIPSSNVPEEEAGFSTFLTIFCSMVGLLGMMLIFTAFIRLYADRHLSQIGADAASLASAQYYMDRLSVPFGSFIGVPYKKCPELNPVTVIREAEEKYRDFYRFVYTPALQWAARADAEHFAGRNGAQIRHFSAWPQYLPIYYRQFRYEDQQTGVVFEPVVSKVQTTREYTSRSGQVHKVPAYATAITYMTNIDKFVVPYVKLYPPCFGWIVLNVYSWDLRLVRDVQ